MSLKKLSAVLVFAFFLFSGLLLTRDSSFAYWDPVPVSGTRKLLIVLTSFSDRASTTTPSGWNATVFDTTSGAKSVANYYNDNSLGNLTVVPAPHSQTGNPAGIVSVTLASNHPDYGNNITREAETPWLQEALDIIVANGYVDFPALDTNSDGIFQNEELVVYFIPSGYEAASSNKTPNIWAHAWSATPGLPAGGVELRTWAMNGELDDNDNQLGMGTIAHELGHSMCKLPDLYDTTYTNYGMGAFTLMAVGSYGRRATGEISGTTPVGLDAWSRQYLGWTAPVEALGPCTYTFRPALDPANSPLKLTKPDASASQYFLAENRYNEGWDLGLERWLGTDWGGGILIQHIDTSIGSLNGYVAGSHQGVMIEEASTTNGSLVDNTSVGHYTHMFYDPNNSAFTDGSTPDSTFYDNVSTGLSLTAISAKARVMTADIGPSAAAVPDFFNKYGGTGSLSVDAVPGYAWTASSNYAWITLDPSSSGTGSGSVGFSVSANNLDEERQGTVSVAGQTATITQEGSLMVTPASVTAGYGGGRGAALVSCSSGYTWGASSNDYWITIVSGSSGTGNGTVCYMVESNPEFSPRQGTMTVAGKTVTVEQGMNNSGSNDFDNFDTPKAIDCLPYADMTNNLTASDGVNDPVPSCGIASGTVWYSYESTSLDFVTITTAGSLFDTVLAVYNDMGGILAEIACNNDTTVPPSPQSSLTFSAMPGITYYIIVGGANNERGSLTLSAACSGGECPGCPSDTVAPASLITDNALTATELTVSGIASDGGGRGVTWVELSVDGGMWHPATDTSGDSSWSSWSCTLVMPADGTHYIQSRSFDRVNNAETPSQTYTLQLENTRPTSSIVNPSNGMPITGRSYSISGMSDDGTGSGVAKVDVSINGGLTWEPTDYYPGASWSYNWVVGSAGSHNIRSRATDNKGNVEIPGAGVNVTVDAIGSTELQHYNWDASLSGDGCALCHISTSTFSMPAYKNDQGFCFSCHNAAGVSHGKGLYGNNHSTMINATTGGVKMPTYGNITAGERNNQPYARLNAGRVVCVTCHNVMQKSEDIGRTWEYTTTTDNLTYTIQYGDWAGYKSLVPNVYRDTSLWGGPTYSKTKKNYLVDPSEYNYNETIGTLTFLAAQDPTAYIYVSLDYPYLRASNAGNTLCADCHTQATHKGENCQTCHTAHNTANIKGIRGSLRASNCTSIEVKFQGYTGSNSFADGDGTHDGICEVCHTQTKYYRRDGTGFINHSGGADHSGKDCTDCHSHSSGFPK